MIRLIFIIIVLLTSVVKVEAQFLKSLFKYSTVYTSGNISMPMLQDFREFYVTQEGEVRDITIEPKYDYRYSVGIRKIARFDYENRANQFYNGSEKNVSLTSNVGSVKGWEYMFQYDWIRNRGDEYTNERYFVRYLGKRFLVKAEQRKEGSIDFTYTSADVRFRFPIGSKIDISAGVIYRNSEKVFGLNPIEEYLAPDTVNWWDLAYDYGYTDHFYAVVFDEDKDYDWYWTDSTGVRVADSDLDFRRHVYKRLVNKYNKDELKQFKSFGYISAVVGYDIYHYSDRFYIHNWLSVMPKNSLIHGDKDFSYETFVENKWVDYQAGLLTGIYVGKKKQFGFFLEGEYSKLWDKRIYNAQVGFNYNFK
tara:strand:- start:7917 stop:9008 length:1092 start_codon:yes stop_codon:yes gene_type:complete